MSARQGLRESNKEYRKRLDWQVRRRKRLTAARRAAKKAASEKKA